MPDIDNAKQTLNLTNHLMIHGTVQGVWFRASMQTQAHELGVAGWCRNTLDGCVEAVIHGDTQQTQAMVAWCHQGPELAQVRAVEVTPMVGAQDSLDCPKPFEIRR